MDRLLARRLEREPEFRLKLVKMVKDYLKLGRDALAYWCNDFDRAYDLLACYAPIEKADLDLLEKGHPKRFILPMTATQITTMATYISQVLFGQSSPWKVEGRRPEDEVPAEFMNQLLRWNAEQQPTYMLGYLWIMDALATNRGVFYNSWQPIFRPQVTEEDVPDPEDVDPATGQPRTYKRTRRTEVVVGGYNKMHIVAPYDFVCDPALPLWRLPEMRFAGHRTMIPVIDLQRRSKLPIDHPAYVMPWAVKELEEKAKKGVTQSDVGIPSTVASSLQNPNDARLSRTAYERNRSIQPTGINKADKFDRGNVECWELWVTISPDEYEIYGVAQEGMPATPTKFQLLIAGGDVLLALNESTFKHGHFPYVVGEGRPSAHFQFSPGWVGMIKGLQDHVDWLKNRHHEALSRTIGNIFVIDPSAVDVTDFMDPDKEGLMIALKPEAYGKKIDEVFKQIPIRDMTERFQEEAMGFVRFAESVTAANSSMQGAQQEAEGSATEYAGTQQMSAGRMTSIARLLSSEALVPQTQQFVSNFQQFLDQPQAVRFVSEEPDLPEPFASARTITISKDTVQGEYDFIAHDGTLPGTDARKVAAITRILEGAAMFPQLFTPQPGNLDPRLLVIAAAKASGLNVENFVYTAKDLAAQAGPPAGAPPEALPGAEGPTLPPLPPIPPAGPQVTPPGTPGPKPAVPGLPGAGSVSLPGLGLPQVRPANS